MRRKVNVFGASGSGTTTLGRELARRWGLTFFDADDFYWEKTDPPFQTPRDREARQRLLGEALAAAADGWVLAGSICGWGDGCTPLLDLAVFVVTPTDVRLDRLKNRERRHFGQRIAVGGDMHANHCAFLEWAAQYDDGSSDMRSRRLHEEWQQMLSCPVVRVDGSDPVEALCDQIVRSSESDTRSTAPPTMTLRSATASDIPFLERVFLDSMKECITLARNGWDASRESAQFRRQLDLEATRIIEYDSADIGLVMIVHTASDVQIHSLCVAPPLQGRGIGTAVVKRFIAEAQAKQAGVILSVLKVNARARTLYERLQFVVVSESEHHYHMRFRVSS